MRLPAALATCLLALACTTTTAQVDGNEPKPDASAKVEEPPADPEPADDSVDAPLPDCPGVVEGALPIYCTDDGKLAGKWVMADLLKVPDDVEILFNAKAGDQPPQSSLQIAARGDELYIKHVTCGACRRVLGRAFVGHPSHMSEEQLRDMQGLLGLGDDAPLLASTAAWAEYCRDEAGKQALTDIAARGEGEGEAEADARGR